MIIEKNYTKVPNNFRTRRDLTPNQWHLMVYLLHYRNDKSDLVWPSTATMRAELRWGKELLFNTLAQLEERGFIRREKRDGRNWKNANVYRLLPKILEEEPVVREDLRQLSDYRTTHKEQDLRIDSKESMGDSKLSLPILMDSIPEQVLPILNLFPSKLFTSIRLPKAGTAPSKTLKAFAAELQRIRLGTFLQSHQWDSEWLGGLQGGYQDGTLRSWEDVSKLVSSAIARASELQELGVIRWKKVGPLQFLINSRDPASCRSQFLSFLANKPRTQKEHQVAATKKAVPQELQAKVIQWYGRLNPAARLPQVWQDSEWTQCWFSVRLLMKWWDGNNAAINAVNDDGQWSYKMRQPESLVRDVLAYLADGRAGRTIRPKLLEPDGYGWDAYIAHLREDFDIRVPGHFEDFRIRRNTK